MYWLLFTLPRVYHQFTLLCFYTFVLLIPTQPVQSASTPCILLSASLPGLDACYTFSPDWLILFVSVLICFCIYILIFVFVCVLLAKSRRLLHFLTRLADADCFCIRSHLFFYLYLYVYLFFFHSTSPLYLYLYLYFFRYPSLDAWYTFPAG